MEYTSCKSCSEYVFTTRVIKDPEMVCKVCARQFWDEGVPEPLKKVVAEKQQRRAEAAAEADQGGSSQPRAAESEASGSARPPQPPSGPPPPSGSSSHGHGAAKSAGVRSSSTGSGSGKKKDFEDPSYTAWAKQRRGGTSPAGKPRASSEPTPGKVKKTKKKDGKPSQSRTRKPERQKSSDEGVFEPESPGEQGEAAPGKEAAGPGEVPRSTQEQAKRTLKALAKLGKATPLPGVEDLQKELVKLASSQSSKEEESSSLRAGLDNLSHLKRRWETLLHAEQQAELNVQSFNTSLDEARKKLEAVRASKAALALKVQEASEGVQEALEARMSAMFESESEVEPNSDSTTYATAAARAAGKLSEDEFLKVVAFAKAQRVVDPTTYQRLKTSLPSLTEEITEEVPVEEKPTEDQPQEVPGGEQASGEVPRLPAEAPAGAGSKAEAEEDLPDFEPDEDNKEEVKDDDIPMGEDVKRAIGATEQEARKMARRGLSPPAEQAPAAPEAEHQPALAQAAPAQASFRPGFEVNKGSADIS